MKTPAAGFAITYGLAVANIADGFTQPQVLSSIPNCITNVKRSTELSVLSNPKVIAAGVGLTAAAVGKLVLDKPSRPYDENSVATEYGKLNLINESAMSGV
jgi:hypothetical protein